MRFELYTLVDITDTGARKGVDNTFEVKQYQNWLTCLQTMSLRVNPIVNFGPKCTEESISNYGFGKDYKGKNKVWFVEFEVEYEGGLDLDILKTDFNYVPIIEDLDETITIKTPAFITQDVAKTNIIFKIVDK